MMPSENKWHKASAAHDVEKIYRHRSGGVRGSVTAHAHNDIVMATPHAARCRVECMRCKVYIMILVCGRHESLCAYILGHFFRGVQVPRVPYAGP